MKSKATSRVEWPELSAYRTATFPQQARAVLDPSRFVHISAAVRTGKSFGGSRRFMRRLVLDRANGLWSRDLETVYWCVAPTRELTIIQKKALIPMIPSWQIDWTRQQGDKRWLNTARGGGVIYLRGGGKIEYRTADNPEALVGESVAGFWVTEAARVPMRSLANLRARVSNTGGWGIYETSPLGRCAYWKEYIEPLKAGSVPDSSLHEWGAVDSPFISPAEVANARATLPESFFKRDYEASWDTFQGQIYEWDDARHLKPLSFTPESTIVAVDLNTTSQHPASFIVAQVCGDRLWVESEYREVIGLDYERYLTAIAQACREHPGAKLVIDPSMHRELKQRLREYGLVPHDATNDVLPGIRCMGSALKSGRLTVNPSCKAFAEEARGYAWQMTADGLCRPSPDKTGMEGLMDAARYACMAVMSKPGRAQTIR